VLSFGTTVVPVTSALLEVQATWTTAPVANFEAVTALSSIMPVVIFVSATSYLLSSLN
jgi:hypothetical protein